MRRIALALILLAAPIAAQTPEKTPANAFAFIQSSMGDGSWTGNAFRCDDQGQDCYPDSGFKITSVQIVGGSYCVIRFTMATDQRPYRVTRDVNLTKSISIDFWSLNLNFLGPIGTTNGEVVDGWTASTSNYESGDRVLKAFQFLQAACKPASPW